MKEPQRLWRAERWLSCLRKEDGPWPISCCLSSWSVHAQVEPVRRSLAGLHPLPLTCPAQVAPFSGGAPSLTSEWENPMLWEATHSTTPNKNPSSSFQQLSKWTPLKHRESEGMETTDQTQPQEMAPDISKVISKYNEEPLKCGLTRES